jgi:hypothetical protein
VRVSSTQNTSCTAPIVTLHPFCEKSYYQIMPVDRAHFESIVANLLKQKPATRKQQRTGKKKTGKIIPPTPQAPK